MNLFVLTGGSGEEREISLNSANYFISLIDISAFDVFLIELSSDGKWFFDGVEVCFVFEGKNCSCIFYDKILIVDFIFPIIHGKGAEDGAIHGVFQLQGFKKVIANNLLSSVLSFDKIISKQLAQSLNIPILDYIDYYFLSLSFDDACKQLQSDILFLKPSDNGSSFGCLKATNQAEYDNAIISITRISRYPLIEPYLSKKIECSCSVLFEEVSDVIAIYNNNEFFSYEAKYLNHEFFVKILENENLVQKIQQYSRHLFKAMKLDFICRFDFFIDENQNVFFNEANSIPGLGDESLFFSSFAQKYSKQELVDLILKTWVAKFFES